MRRLITSALVTLLLVATGAFPVLAEEPGDEPDTAIAVDPGTSTWDSSLMTENAADDPANCDPFPGPLFATMWFRWDAGRGGNTIVDVNSFVSSDGLTDFLAVVFVYRDDGGTLSLVGCSAYPATVTLNAARGASYVIMVAGLSTEATEEPDLSDKGGTFDLMITTIKGRVLRDHFHDSGSFVDEYLCDVPVTLAWDDNATIKTFFGTDGVRRFTSFYQGATSFSVEGGSTLVLKYASTFTDRIDGTGRYTGLAQDVWLDGRRVVKDVGLLIFDFQTGEVIVDAGDHPQWYTGLDFCAQLGVGPYVPPEEP